MKIIFIIGLQKSGTSLLNRLLMQQPSVTNPFLPEGKFFWGDDPPFTPTASPCGKLFQLHNGIQGHHLTAQDFRLKDQQLLVSRIKQANVTTPILMNKNPYNSVRIEWLKVMFPDCKIVAIYRKPEANIFSLSKKYLNTPSPVDWWGVKPNNWQKLIDPNKILQISNQWNTVNEQIINNINDLDYLLSYSSLCETPELHLTNILSLVNEKAINLVQTPITCMDTEFKTGGSLESMNKIFRQSIPDNKTQQKLIEIQALNNKQLDVIHNITNETYQVLKKQIISN